MDSKQRILIVAHGHPDHNKGGAEIAAYNLYNEYRRRGLDAYFLARSGLTPHGGAAFSARNDGREMLFHTTHDDWFLYSNVKTRHMWQEFRDLLLLLKPDVVHLHHYFLLGIEIIEEIRRTLPQCRIILTLHEFMAICHRNGLMYKTNNKLCYKANPRDCHGCFSDRQPGDFYLRERYIKRILSQVDHFVSPSHFLKQRYVEWGLAEQSIDVIENGLPLPFIEAGEASATKVRFAFFGQVNPFKGIDVLLEAYLLLPKTARRQVSLDIHGASLEHQSGEFQQHVKDLLELAGSGVRLHGSYEGHEMPALLAEADWVIVPSVWWENSPIVIQEALNNSTPLIVSDIGGMAEKVEHGVNGLHFRAGKAASLAAVMTRVLEDKSIHPKLVAGIQPPMTIAACADAHLAVYS